MRLAISFVCVFCLCGMISCVRVHQIDRDVLSKPIMKFEPAPHRSAMRQEFHGIREGAAGGAGTSAGGGCGCN